MSYEVIHIEKLKARKAHQCHWCYETIPVGTTYHRERGKFEGEPQTTKMHVECEAASAQWFAKYGESSYEPGEFKRGTMESIHD